MYIIVICRSCWFSLQTTRCFAISCRRVDCGMLLKHKGTVCGLLTFIICHHTQIIEAGRKRWTIFYYELHLLPEIVKLVFNLQYIFGLQHISISLLLFQPRLPSFKYAMAAHIRFPQSLRKIPGEDSPTCAQTQPSSINCVGRLYQSVIVSPINTIKTPSTTVWLGGWVA
jgi:hypothetical protein